MPPTLARSTSSLRRPRRRWWGDVMNPRGFVVNSGILGASLGSAISGNTRFVGVRGGRMGFQFGALQVTLFVDSANDQVDRIDRLKSP